MKTLHLDPTQLRPVATGFGACYDPSVVKHLAAAVGSAFERDPDSDRWEKVEDM